MILNMINNINSFVIYLALVLIGLCLGSFAGATVWRMRARQLLFDEKNDDITELEIKELKKIKKIVKSPKLKDRSQCLNCSYQLRWFDLIPLISWLSLKGKCRKCRKPIGYLEPLIEFGVAIFFVVSFVVWPYSFDMIGLIRFVLWLIAGVILSIAVAYDMKWFLIPNKISFAVIGIGIINSLVVVLSAADILGTIMSILGSVLILSGIYCFVYFLSKGQWIGFGDVKLGLGLALMLADWNLAFIALFMANFIGCLIVIPPMIMKKIKRDSRIPFGPLLILGYVIAGLFGSCILNTYLSLLFL